MLRALRLSLTATIIGVAVTSAAPAQSPPPKPYFDISAPQLVNETNKVEVVEVFNYFCIHCAHFQPLVDQWRKKLDTTKVQFVYLPATFNPPFQLLAKAYYTAASMDVAEKTHQGVFDAIHVRNMPTTNFDQVADLYASLGVSRESFMKASESFLVATQTRRANDLITRYRVDSTPTMIVAGKYRVTMDSSGGPDKIFQVVDQLIAQELAQTGTSRQAPSKGK